VLKLTFAKRLAYARDGGFRTAEPSLPFQIIQGLGSQSESDFDVDSMMAEGVSVFIVSDRIQRRLKGQSFEYFSCNHRLMTVCFIRQNPTLCVG
jgi:hypothetical protein